IINNKENKSESELKTEKEILELFQSMGFKTEDEFNFKIYSLVELLYKNTELIRQKFIESKNKNSIRSGTETIESKILADLKPVCYYGCVLLRTEGVTRFDNMENPTSMEEILDCVGIKSGHFRFKTECCGAILSLTHKKIVLKLSKEILDASIEAGANSIVVCCPLCQQNLDLRQSQINKYYKTNYHIPVYYISQILGLAMGLSYRDVMIDRLFVEPEFLKK
ncbi:MAG: heterodisulfide reductase-related iron-sulfur binding cluster, partial [Actinomycetota bacterium]